MKQLNKGNAPVKIFAGGKTVAYFEYGDLPEKDVQTVPSIIVKSRGVIEFEYYEKPFSHKNEMWSYHSENAEIETKFIYYFLKTKELKLREKATSMGAFPQIAIPDTETLQIPLPPLPVQREIVRILDNFTLLTAELTARKKQYEYYRNELLTLPDAPMVTLGNVLKIRNGKDYKGFGEGNIPVYGTGGIMTYIDRFAYDKPSVLIPRKGSIDKLYYVDMPFWTVDTIFYTEIYINVVIPKFVYYYLQMVHLENMNTAGGVPSLTQTVLNKVEFPVPSLTEQARIVAILDRFDALTTNITSGLPAEIAARQNQYEYYRDKLLTFKGVSA
jgi:type I restriction enzyme S subunit